MDNLWIETEIAAQFWEHYHLRMDRIEEIDAGADADSQVFRIKIANSHAPFFLKTRPYAQAQPGIEIPAFLAKRGIAHILPSVPTIDSEPCFQYRGKSFILYPFLEGSTAMEKGLTRGQWMELGFTMHAIHNLALPERIHSSIPQETFAPVYRRQTEGYLNRSLAGELQDGPGSILADLLRGYEKEIRRMLERADALGKIAAKKRNLRFVLCHADFHKWNIFITDHDDLFVLDWDSARLAPRECDLMFIGGNIGGDRRDENEVPGFFEGYLNKQIDPQLLAYYRYERILEDIAEFGKQVWEGGKTGREECEKITGWLAGNFNPGAEYASACQSDIK